VAGTPKIYPIILSGGSGSRLWPLSREDFPKQLQALAGEKTLLQETALRLMGEGLKVEPPIVVCNEAHRFIVDEQLRHVGITPKAIVIEPMGRNTAPAIAAAALLLKDEPDALFLSMASDHIVRKPEAFRAAVATAVPVARAGRLVTLGITPTYPETGYGYIKRGAPIAGTQGFAVERFVEKPDAQTARGYLSAGGYSWNASIFLFPVALFLDELSAFEPAIVPGCESALARGKNDLFFFRLDADTFAKVPNRSIDHAIMERTDKAAVVPVDMGWSDVGSWSALHAVSQTDANGNALIGDVLAIDAQDSYIRSDKQITAVLGAKNLTVVVTTDAVLVADKSRDQDVKLIVEQLKSKKRAEATQHARTYRPWGWFQTMDEGPRFKVKRLCVKPGGQLSLQKHAHRSEHWVVVTGKAWVSCDGEDFFLHENESTFIPAGSVHRLANPWTEDLHMIEVQSGSYVGEDDIVRLADDYGRTVSGKAATKSISKTKKKKPKLKQKIRRKAGAVPAKRRSARRRTTRRR
jgi:mannose-1-phosphate guanylyltransferase / mannose-6-phosphate isomerase